MTLKLPRIHFVLGSIFVHGAVWLAWQLPGGAQCPLEIPRMDTHRNWWQTGGDNALQCVEDAADDCPQPIPFPSRRARMSLRPPHASDVATENRMSAFNAGEALEAVALVNRKMNDLARELDCLWFYDDEDDSDDSPETPSAA